MILKSMWPHTHKIIMDKVVFLHTTNEVSFKHRLLCFPNKLIFLTAVLAQRDPLKPLQVICFLFQIFSDASATTSLKMPLL